MRLLLRMYYFVTTKCRGLSKCLPANLQLIPDDFSQNSVKIPSPYHSRRKRRHSTVGRMMTHLPTTATPWQSLSMASLFEDCSRNKLMAVSVPCITGMAARKKRAQQTTILPLSTKNISNDIKIQKWAKKRKWIKKEKNLRYDHWIKK